MKKMFVLRIFGPNTLNLSRKDK